MGANLVGSETCIIHPLVAHLVEPIRGPTYVLYTELNRIPAYFQLNGNNKRKKSEAVARTWTNMLI